MAGTPPGFVESDVRAGLYQAMQFGKPSGTDESLVFHVPSYPADPGSTYDQSGVPFDPSQSKSAPTYELVEVACAVEYQDRPQVYVNPELVGSGISNAVLKITMLDTEYQQVRGFDWCSAKASIGSGSERYFYRRTQPAIGMGTIDVFIIYCEAEDES